MQGPFTALFLLQALQKRQLGFLISFVSSVQFASIGMHAVTLTVTASLHFVPGGRGVSSTSIAAPQRRGPSPNGSHLFCGLLPIPTFFLLQIDLLNLLCALLYGNPYKGHVLSFYPQNPEECLLQKKKKRKSIKVLLNM